MNKTTFVVEIVARFIYIFVLSAFLLAIAHWLVATISPSHEFSWAWVWVVSTVLGALFVISDRR